LLLLNVFSFIIYNNSIVRFVMSLRVVCRVFSQRTLFFSVQRLSKFDIKLSRQFFFAEKNLLQFQHAFWNVKMGTSGVHKLPLNNERSLLPTICNVDGLQNLIFCNCIFRICLSNTLFCVCHNNDILPDSV